MTFCIENQERWRVSVTWNAVHFEGRSNSNTRWVYETARVKGPHFSFVNAPLLPVKAPSELQRSDGIAPKVCPSALLGIFLAL